MIRSRILWVCILAGACIGIYVGLWWPAWETAGKSNTSLSNGPGHIDQQVWPYVGNISSSVRIRPTSGLYDSLTITLDLAGQWDGFHDARGVLPPRVEDENRLSLRLERRDGSVQEMMIDNTRGGMIYFGTPQEYTNKHVGPIDASLVRRWLQLGLTDKVDSEDLDAHASAIFGVLVRAMDRNAYPGSMTRMVNNRTIVEDGRLARAVGLGYTNYLTRQQSRKFEFKEWTGRQSINIRRKNDNFIAIGAGTMIGLFAIGYWGIRRVTTLRRKPIEVESSASAL